VRTGLRLTDRATVTEVYEGLSNQGLEVRFTPRGRPAGSRSLQTTDEHLFWVDGRGWTAASALKPGDWLVLENGTNAEVTGTDRIKDPIRVHTFRLHGDSAFYADGVLVHDLCGAEPPREGAAAREESR